MRKFYKILSLILTATIFCALALPIYAQQAPNKNAKVITVGFPLQSGLAVQNENGELSGYNYDYLQEIAQFTGWDYEYKVVSGSDNNSITNLFQMLQNGEIDILGGMLYDDELAKTIKYASFNYSTRYDGLYTLCDNNEINENNYYNQSPLRVAVMQGAKKANARLDTFASANNLNITKINCNTTEEKLVALNDGKADVMWETNISSPESTYPIAKYFSQPIYFAFSPNNAELAAQFDTAMVKLSKSSPNLNADLQEKYFSRTQTEFVLTDEETEYLKAVPPLNIAVANDHGPAYFFDNISNSHRGISIDILDHLSEKTGIKYNLIQTKTQLQASELLANGKADLLARVALDFELAKQNNYILSRPYLNTQMVMATSDATKAYTKSALPLGSGASLKKSEDIVYYNSLHECMTAANNGDVMSVFGDSSTIEFELNSRQFQKLVVVPIIGENAAFSFGISKNCDPMLLNIINKLIDSFSSSELQDMIFANSSLPQDSLSLMGTIRAYPVQSITFIVCMSCVLIIFLGVLLYFKSRHSNDIALANERYLRLSEISGEYIFEYDFIADRITMSDSMIKEFNCERVVENFSKTPNNTFLPIMPFTQGLEAQTPCEINVQLANGETCWYKYTCNIIKDKHGKPLQGIGKLSNVGVEHMERELLEKKATEDFLTGLLNTSSLRGQISAALSASNNEGNILVMFDIDNFKEINDTYGHYGGDKVLKQVALAMKNTFANCELIGRYGGDEFMAYVGSANNSNLANLLKDLQDRCRTIILNGKNYSVTLSIGAAYYHEGDNFDDLYKRADDALYKVKLSSKDGIIIV